MSRAIAKQVVLVGMLKTFYAADQRILALREPNTFELLDGISAVMTNTLGAAERAKFYDYCLYVYGYLLFMCPLYCRPSSYLS
ncbi:hypothetical protein [secondary endosymbiont of Ctenarytaina eucalypti]|uniref:Uncharacterized protein n=1 Tax=secondary endosymbiont of Ctenarytaina eucalypti TaxID=1199245 RepID=J3YS91_9ENTR|nr:hypothetical protein [secondary endosymbiont of Ctenarytaina eucalypti]AFP85063.1 hypothetical protein A359_06780 [secondary endosymbiont of Ctenarytaina eucalypti]